jgi:hypothetical protein
MPKKGNHAQHLGGVKMAKNNLAFFCQVPADAHNLMGLIMKLGIVLGPLKSVQIGHRDEDGGEKIDLWFVQVVGVSGVKRVSARLVVVKDRDRLVPTTRRVYLGVKVQKHNGEWREMVDKDFLDKNLSPPWQYDLPWHIVVDDCGGRWEDVKGGEPVNLTIPIPYYRFLPGDRERAITEALAIIASMTTSESADAE